MRKPNSADARPPAPGKNCGGTATPVASAARIPKRIDGVFPQRIRSGGRHPWRTRKGSTCRGASIGGLCLLVLAGSGCKSIGPPTVTRDRIHYATAVADSWKEQLLLNIVKTRYGDAPGFLEVDSVVAGYSLETGVSLGGQYSPADLRGDTYVAGGVSGKYTDRPTISYSPMSGAAFARSLMSPVPLDALWFVIQGGVPADFILGLTVQSFEGYHNMGLSGGQFQAADPQFTQLLRLLRALQAAKVTESNLVRDGDKLEAWVRFHPVPASQAGLAEQLAEVKCLLGIPDEADRVKVEFGVRASDPAVIGVRTRSLMQILSTLGAGVQFAPEILADDGIIPVGFHAATQGFTVHSGRDRPDSAFTAVPYEGLWFWIDRRDIASKETLATVTLLFNFLEGGAKASPVLTIPTN